MTISTSVSRLSQIELGLPVARRQYDNPVLDGFHHDKVSYGVVMRGKSLASAQTLSRLNVVWLEANDDSNVAAAVTPHDVGEVVSGTYRKDPAITIVRLPSFDTPNMKPYLDAGALGVAAPGIHDAADAQAFVKASKYPPAGARGVGPAESTQWLADVPSAVNFANDSITDIVMIDNADAVRNAADIARVPGIDVLFIEPRTLAASLKMDEKSTAFADTVASIELAAREAGKVLGTRADQREDAVALHARGYRLLLVGEDTHFIRAALDRFESSAPPAACEAPLQKPRGPFDNPVKRAVAAGKVNYGGFMMGDAPQHAREFSQRTNFIWFDGEHSPWRPQDIRRTLQANPDGTAIPVVRVPRWDHPDIAAFLDAGARGIVCPSVNSPAEARAFVAAVKFAPLGNRPVTAEFKARAGANLEDAMARENEAVMAVVMTETKTGLECVEQVAAVPGIDVLHIGPYDLALSLGAPMGSDAHQQAMARIETAARDQGVALGGLALDRKQAQAMHARGYRFLTIGSDQEAIQAGMRPYAIFPPVDAQQTLQDADLLLRPFRGAEWKPFRTEEGPGKQAQIVSDSRGTLVHLKIDRLPSGVPFAHSHPYRQQTTILQGAVRTKVGDLPERDLVAGETVVIPGGMPHSFTELTPQVELVDEFHPAWPAS